nr:NAD(P)-dependent oxidoreductase [Hyphomonas sp. Mor2]
MADFSGISDLAGQRVVVTGGSGFIGQRVVAALLENGAEVTALARNKQGANLIAKTGAIAIVTALTETARIADLLASTDALVHLAYDVRASGQANLQTFKALIEAAQQARIRRIVHMSSIVVYDGWPTEDLDAESPIGSAGGSPYRRAKMEMEETLMKGDLPAAILQPTLVYGAGSALWTDGLAQHLARGGLVLPEPEGVCNAVYVDDVAQAVVHAVNLPDLGRERFLISGRSPVSWTDLLSGYAASVGGEIQHEPATAIADALGPEPEIQDTPSLAARISAFGRRAIGNSAFDGMVNTAKAILGQRASGPMWPDHHLFRVFTATGTCRIDAAQARLGYEPRYDLPAGLAAIAPYLERRFRSPS